MPPILFRTGMQKINHTVLSIKINMAKVMKQAKLAPMVNAEIVFGSGRHFINIQMGKLFIEHLYRMAILIVILNRGGLQSLCPVGLRG